MDDILRNFACRLVRKPGMIGRVAARVIGESDRLVNEWVIAHLELKSGDRILELGCGVGAAISSIARRNKEVFVVGAEQSPELISQAWIRNRRAARERRVMLLHSDFTKGFPEFSASFSKVFAINLFHHLKQPVDMLHKVRKLMEPGGKIVLAAQPREPGSTDATSLQLGKELRSYLAEAGFYAIKLDERELKPVAAVCVTALNPAATPATEQPQTS